METEEILNRLNELRFRLDQTCEILEGTHDLKDEKGDVKRGAEDFIKWYEERFDKLK